jgi:hypothetical protein
MVLPVESLEHAPAPAASSRSHGIVIAVLPDGRFLQCSECKLRVRFPDAAQYGVTAKQFEFHPCGSTARRLIILKYEYKVPVMASCARCQRKFFTPSSPYVRDIVGSGQYLATKFDEHHCVQTVEVT